MEKQKFFLLFIVAAAIVIFLQQDSLQFTNRHWNKSNQHLESIHAANHSDSPQVILGNAQKIVQQEWPYNKFIHALSKSMSKGFKDSKSKDKLKSWIHGFNPLSHFPVYRGQNVSRVLLLGYFRSGSSFVGDLLQQNWKSFYTFEPLHLMTRAHRIDEGNLTSALNLISGIFNCDFRNNEYYVKWVEKNQFLLKWNKFLWNVCRFRPESCFDADYVSDACSRSKYNIVKLVRLPLGQLEILWKQIAPLNVRVVYLVRDPRGIYNSRRRMEWCNTEEICGSIHSICAEMRQDIVDFDRLKALLGDNLILVKYEDISLDPQAFSRELFRKLKIEYSASVSRFLKTHTKSQHHRSDQLENPYSTYRANSSLTALQWMHDLNATEIEFAQQNCSDILARFNFTIV